MTASKKKLRIDKPTLYKRANRIEEELADEPSQLNQDNLNGSRWFLFLPTKRHWRNPSILDDIEKSMQWFLKNYDKEGSAQLQCLLWIVVLGS